MSLGGLIAIAMPVYFGIAFLIGGADIGMVRRSLKRGKKSADDAATTLTDTDQQ